MTDKPTVALLGTGIMGAGMARNIARAGLPLRVWNRTREKAESLVGEGAELADTPAEAVEGVDVVITMLGDGESVASAIRRAAEGLRAGQVWAQMSTVGVAATAELAEIAARYGLVFVDAPVLGTRGPAEQGQLLVLAAGPQQARDVLGPVFDAVGRRTSWLGVDGSAAAATRVKLVANSWVLAITNGVGEALALADALGVDPQDFLDAVGGGPLDLPYLQLKAAAILDEDWTPSFSVANAAKDAGLIMDAADVAGVRLDVVAAARDRLSRAIEQGHGEKDMAANYLASFDADRDPDRDVG